MTTMCAHSKVFRGCARRLFARDLIAGARASAGGNGAAAAHVLDDDPATFWSPPRGTLQRLARIHAAAGQRIRRGAAGGGDRQGQHIANYRVDTWQHGAWKPLTWGTTIGHRKLDRTPLTRTRAVAADGRARLRHAAAVADRAAPHARGNAGVNVVSLPLRPFGPPLPTRGEGKSAIPLPLWERAAREAAGRGGG